MAATTPAFVNNVGGFVWNFGKYYSHPLIDQFCAKVYFKSKFSLFMLLSSVFYITCFFFVICFDICNFELIKIYIKISQEKHYS